MLTKTFRVKLGCDNCGHDDVYNLPKRSVVVDWKKPEESYEQTTYSYYYPFGKEDKKVYLICNQCGLAMLRVFWWRESGFEPSTASQKEENDGSGDSRTAD